MLLLKSESQVLLLQQQNLPPVAVGRQQLPQPSGEVSRGERHRLHQSIAMEMQHRQRLAVFPRRQGGTQQHMEKPCGMRMIEKALKDAQEKTQQLLNVVMTGGAAALQASSHALGFWFLHQKWQRYFRCHTGSEWRWLALYCSPSSCL